MQKPPEDTTDWWFFTAYSQEKDIRVDGRIKAPTLSAAADILLADGYIPMKLSPVKKNTWKAYLQLKKLFTAKRDDLVDSGKIVFLNDYKSRKKNDSS